MANRLSDDELRKSLKEYGEDVGPITPTTRSTWERRLTSLRKSKNFSQRKTSLNAFSSDDSEIESPSSSAQRRKRTSLNRQDLGERSEKLNLSHPSSLISSLDGETFKKPTSTSSPSFTIQGKKMLLDRSKFTKSISGKLKRNTGKQAAYDVETSDSDFDTDSSFSLSKSPRRVRRKNNFSIVSTDVTTPHLTEKPINFENSLHRKTVNSTWNSNIESSYQHMNPNATRLKRELNNPDYHSNGYISNTLSNGGLSEERLEQGSSTNYSHCISWLLVLGTATFFFFIGAVYVTELQKTSQMASKSYSKFCNGIEEDHCKNLILMSRELHHLLTSVAGIYDCSSETEGKKRNLTLSEARMSMKEVFSTSDSIEMDKFDYIFNQSVLLLRKHPNMGIEFYSSHKEETNGVEELSHIDISALEAAQGSKSFWCRIRLSLKWTVAKIVFLLFVALFVFMCFVFAKMWKRYREAQEKVFYEMVEKVIDILQETANWSTEQDSYKAVVKVRDAIIPPKDRKDKLWLWDRVVAFIEENESRVSVEYRTINGEDFKVWRWQPCTTIENEGSKQGKVWQGQAFSSQGKGKNPMYSLSPCLKIRNMFESEVEYEEGWQTSIEDAILEKCEGNNGIRHIAVDTSTNEGCVYMLCSSTESAGKAFNDLHGWWFDGKLVTVKYIPYKRYLERFPESEHRTEPLRPSNNKRLSLSTPFFSSALERS